MGWFSGDFARVNRGELKRMAESKGLMLDIGTLAKRFAAQTHKILSELTTTQMQESSKAREASIAASEVRNERALEEGLAASSNPLVQADVAGAAGADRSVVNTIQARGKIEQGILAKETQEHMEVEDVAKAAEVASKLGAADVLGSVDEAVDEGAGPDVMNLLGIAVGANMDKISSKLKGWFSTDPMADTMAPGSGSLGERPEVKEVEVPGVDVPAGYRTPATRPDVSEVSPVDPFSEMSTSDIMKPMGSLSKSKRSFLDMMSPERRKAYMLRHGIDPSSPSMSSRIRPMEIL